MNFERAGIIGTGLWEGEPVENPSGSPATAAVAVMDPFLGRRDGEGNISIAGLMLSPQDYPRTLDRMRRTFGDPFRGAVRRRIFPDGLVVSDAEAEAGRNALEEAGITAADVGAVLVQSFLGDEIQPGNAPLVAHKLGINHAPAWSVDSLCNSLLSQLTVAGAMVQSGAARHVLCIQSAVYSRVNDAGISSSLQEGDLAAAFVVGPKEGRFTTAWHTDGTNHAATTLRWRLLGPPAARNPQPRLLIDFDKTLQPGMLQKLHEQAPLVCAAALKEAGWALEDVSAFIGHQASAWMLDFLSEAVGLPEGVSFNSFEEYGSVNAPGLTASVHEALLARRIRPGSRVLIFAPAAGGTFGAAALEW